jgi:tetratricopeptide (TPR) repeat protein
LLAWLVALAALTELVSANCVQRGVWYKETYCFPDPEIDDNVYIQSPAEQVAGLVAQATAHMDAGNTLAAWSDLETALRLDPSDSGALAAKARLDQILAEVAKEDEAAAHQAQIRSLRDDAEALVAQGQPDAALDTIRRARQLAPYDLSLLDLMIGIRAKIIEPEVLRRQNEEARKQADYLSALDQAANDTGHALDQLAEATNGTAWADLRRAVLLRDQMIDVPEDARFLAEVPFDRFDGLVSQPALDLFSDYSGQPRAVPVGPLPTTARVQQLVSQIDYWEGQQRQVEEAVKAEVDPAKREQLVRKGEIVQSLKAEAGSRLIAITPKLRE